MKNRYAAVFALLLSMNALGHADQTASEGEEPVNQKKEPRFIEYHNRVNLFTPGHQIYERIKPDALYVGVERFKINLWNQGRKNELTDFELRIGYNHFYNGRDHLTSFSGMGYLEDNRPRHHKPAILYWTTGFLYDHEFNSIFNLGCNMKVLFGGPLGEKHDLWGSFVFASYISVPITFRFGYKRHWDFRIEPFNLALHGTNMRQDYLGGLSTLGYRF